MARPWGCPRARAGLLDDFRTCDPWMVTSNLNPVSCAGCGIARPSELGTGGVPRTPCPECGTVAIGISVSASEEISIRETTAVQLRRAGRQKPVMTSKVGASQSADGRWAHVEQVVDRETGRYRKKVVLEDGTVVKDYDGPLDGGHGDPRKWPPESESSVGRAR
jgi:hypothetical protein